MIPRVNLTQFDPAGSVDACGRTGASRAPKLTSVGGFDAAKVEGSPSQTQVRHHGLRLNLCYGFSHKEGAISDGREVDPEESVDSEGDESPAEFA